MQGQHHRRRAQLRCERTSGRLDELDLQFDLHRVGEEAGGGGADAEIAALDRAGGGEAEVAGAVGEIGEAAQFDLEGDRVGDGAEGGFAGDGELGLEAVERPAASAGSPGSRCGMWVAYRFSRNQVSRGSSDAAAEGGQDRALGHRWPRGLVGEQFAHVVALASASTRNRPRRLSQGLGDQHGRL